MLCVEWGNQEILELLVEKGSEVNYTHPQTKHTALYEAVINNNPGIVIFLMGNGADGDIPDSHNAFPLYEAVRSENKNLVQVLLDGGCLPNPVPITGRKNESPLLFWIETSINFDFINMIAYSGFS